MSEKKTKTFLSLEKRIAVVKKLESGVSVRKIAEEFKCGRTQISRINQEKEVIKRRWEEGADGSSKLVKKENCTDKPTHFDLSYATAVLCS